MFNSIFTCYFCEVKYKNFSLKKKFITNLAILLFLNLLIKPFWIFGIDRTVQNVLGEVEYGFYFSLFNFSLLLNIALDIGITNFNNKNIAQYNQLLSKYLSNIVVLKIFLALVYFAISILVAFFIGYEWKQFKLLFFLLFNQFLLSFILYLRSNISGLHLFKIDSLVSVLDRTLMIIICSFLLWGNVTKGEFKIEWFVYAQTSAYLITFIITFLIVLSKSEFLIFKINLKYFIIILKQCYPYALLVLLMAFYYRIDSVMLERLLPNGKEQAGIYAQAFRILDAFSMFAFLFAVLLLPMFSKMIKHKEPIEQLTKFSFLLLIIPAITLSMACIFYRVDIINLLYKGNIEASPSIFGILMLCFILISVSYIFGTLLTANGNLKELNIMAVTSVLVNILLNLILIPKFFAFGAAIASLITQAFAALVQVFIAKKVFRFKVNYNLLFLLISFITGILLIGFLLKKIIYSWHYSFLIMLISGIILAFVIKLIKLKVLYQIIKYGDEG